MITVNDVTMSFGERVLFDNVAVTFNAGERYGLTGPNGSGKSTFMKIVTGEIEPVAGHVRLPRRVGFLRQ
jgi:ATPase subunit of ABC transporter with duplicated ATPase domains